MIICVANLVAKIKINRTATSNHDATATYCRMATEKLAWNHV